ncbi:SA1788 family PVL leukocidin-associated protein [Staphylococcus nepalensis]|uniref:SA1788 family PVL leukocidin-associated protein n=1 Tax=Staphylococcus nepalensis TaxID=214473 RepID=UPI003EE5EC38
MKTLMKINNKVYEISKENYETAEELDISERLIRNRIQNNWSIEEACQVPKGMKREDLVYINYAKQYEKDNTIATLNYRDEKQREERPWLYDGTPQPPYPRCKYVDDLMKYDAFPKAVR